MAPSVFNFNPTNVRATTRIYEGDFELIVGEPTPFYNVAKDSTSNDSFGIRYACKIAEGEYAGENYAWQLWLHSDAAMPMTKQFQMACLGYSNDDAGEAQFDEEHGNDDFSVNFEAKTVGEGWMQLKGHRVSVLFSKGINKKNGNAQQQYGNLQHVA